jgi:hypothetical protein
MLHPVAFTTANSGAVASGVVAFASCWQAASSAVGGPPRHKKSRGDKTAIELFREGVSELPVQLSVAAAALAAWLTKHPYPPANQSRRKHLTAMGDQF